jgi:hypothetical protein
VSYAGSRYFVRRCRFSLKICLPASLLANSDHIFMQSQCCSIIFIFGPSGVGKSSFGSYLSNHHNWLHLEIDIPNTNDVDIHEIQHHWSEYRNGNAAPLLAELNARVKLLDRAGCVLTFRSTDLLLNHELEFTQNQGVVVKYFYGTAADCIFSFLQREHKQGSQLGLNHWLIHNQQSYLRMSLPDLSSYRINVFKHNGTRRQWDEISKHIPSFNN